MEVGRCHLDGERIGSLVESRRQPGDDVEDAVSREIAELDALSLLAADGSEVVVCDGAAHREREVRLRSERTAFEDVDRARVRMSTSIREDGTRDDVESSITRHVSDEQALTGADAAVRVAHLRRRYRERVIGIAADAGSAAPHVDRAGVDLGGVGLRGSGEHVAHEVAGDVREKDALPLAAQAAEHVARRGRADEQREARSRSERGSSRPAVDGTGVRRGRVGIRRSGEDIRRFRTGDVMQVEVPDSDSLINGALLGAGLGVAAGLFICRLTEPWEVCFDNVGPLTAFGAIGAGAGIGIDALIRGRRTIYAAPGRTRLEALPVFIKGGGGLQVSVRF